MRVVVGRDAEGLFEAQSDEAREEERRKGVDMEGDYIFGDGGVEGGTRWVCD